MRASKNGSGAAVRSVSLAGGFPLADTPDCGPAALAYAGDERSAAEVADALAGAVLAARGRFAAGFLSPEEAVARADRAGRAGRPAVIADSCDNPGGGGDGDTTGLLRALAAARPEGAVLGLLIDAEAAAAAHEAGEGGRLALALGGRSGIPGDAPFETDAVVRRLGDGSFTCTGPFYGGNRMQLGPMALLEIAGGVRVAVASRKVQAADREMFRHLGVEPADCRILALKSSVHFRADFGPDRRRGADRGGARPGGGGPRRARLHPAPPRRGAAALKKGSSAMPAAKPPICAQ